MNAMQRVYGAVIKLLGGDQKRVDTVLIAGLLYLAIVIVAVGLAAVDSRVTDIFGGS